jgi:TPR repeat protein
VSWYRKAAEQGHAGAQNNLGVMYENGLGVTQDHSQALSLYKKGSELGDANAKENYERLLEERQLDAVIAEMVQTFPALDEDSPRFNQRLFDQVLQRQQELMAQGYSPSNALRAAAFEVFKRR